MTAHQRDSQVVNVNHPELFNAKFSNCYISVIS